MSQYLSKPYEIRGHNYSPKSFEKEIMFQSQNFRRSPAYMSYVKRIMNSKRLINLENERIKCLKKQLESMQLRMKSNQEYNSASSSLVNKASPFIALPPRPASVHTASPSNYYSLPSVATTEWQSQLPLQFHTSTYTSMTSRPMSAVLKRPTNVRYINYQPTMILSASESAQVNKYQATNRQVTKQNFPIVSRNDLKRVPPEEREDYWNDIVDFLAEDIYNMGIDIYDLQKYMPNWPVWGSIHQVSR